MLVDEYEKYNNDRQDVVDINTEETAENAVAEPTADDCTLTLLSFCPLAISFYPLSIWHASQSDSKDPLTERTFPLLQALVSIDLK